MTPNTYRREVLRYLHDEYGISDAVIHNTEGGHRRMRFTYNGQRQALTLHDSPSSFTGTQNPINLKKQDIRRLLGPPPEKLQPIPKRKLEDMMPTIQVEALAASSDSPSIPEKRSTYTGRCSLLPTTTSAQNPRLCFSIPNALYDAFGCTQAIKITRIDEETFDIEPRPGYKSPRFYRMNNGTYATISERTVALKPNITYWGASPAEYLLVDGHLLVTCPIATRRSLRGQKSRTESVEKLSPSPEVSPLPKTASGAQWIEKGAPTASEIRACLQMLRRIEAETEYRLFKGKDTGVWSFVSRIE